MPELRIRIDVQVFCLRVNLDNSAFNMHCCQKSWFGLIIPRSTHLPECRFCEKRSLRYGESLYCQIARVTAGRASARLGASFTFTSMEEPVSFQEAYQLGIPDFKEIWGIF